MCLTSSIPKNNAHISLSVFLLIPFNCHTPASKHDIPLLFFFSSKNTLYDFLPQEKFISRCSFSELFSDIFDKMFRLSVSLHLPFTIFVRNSELQYLWIKLLEPIPVIVCGCHVLSPFYVYQNTRHYIREEDNLLKYFWRRSCRIKGTAQTLGVLCLEHRRPDNLQHAEE